MPIYNCVNMGNVAQGSAQGGKSAQAGAQGVCKGAQGAQGGAQGTLRRPAQGSRCGTKTGPFWLGMA